MIVKFLILAVFGAIGTIARAEMAGFVQRAVGAPFPWGTVAVNMVGSFAFGVVWSATQGRPNGVDIRFAALTGFMGAFTTFSSFMFDVAALAQEGRYVAVATNLALQNVLGLALMFAGFATGRVF